MKRYRTSLMVWMTFEQDREDGEVERPDAEIEREIEDAFDCKAKIVERSDREIESEIG